MQMLKIKLIKISTKKEEKTIDMNSDGP